MNKPEIILLVGNIGTGKTTLAKRIIKKGFSHIVISRDALRYMIGADKYRFDPEIEPAIWASELNILINFMELGQNIIVDEVGISKSIRKRYINIAKNFKYSITVIEMPKLSKKIAVNRRMKNPHQQKDRKLWESIWDKFNSIYEAPSCKEGIHSIIRL